MGVLDPRRRNAVPAAPLPTVRGPHRARGGATGGTGGARGGRRVAIRSVASDALPHHRSDTAHRECFETVTARRPVLEHVLARAADAELGVEVRRGVSVRELVTRSHNGIPHVVAVRTDRGDQLRGDLVVDAMGRRSQLPRWLQAAGTSAGQEQVENAGFIYYTRFFRSRNGALPQFKAPLLTAAGTFSHCCWFVDAEVARVRPCHRARHEMHKQRWASATRADAAACRPEHQRRGRRGRWLLRYGSDSQVRLQVAADRLESKHNGTAVRVAKRGCGLAGDGADGRRHDAVSQLAICETN